MNVLFIGNSYTYYNDLEKIFEGLCRENGHQVNAFRVTKGGRKLISNMDPEDEITKQLEAAIRERHYDVCVIQEQSLLPITDYDTFLAGVTHVMRMVGSQADRFILYATWARKEGSPDLETYGWTPESMTRLLQAAYEKAGEALEVPVSPVGISFWKAICALPELELYNPDMTHPSYLGSCLAALTHYYTLFGHFPENTNSLNLTTEQLTIFRSAVCE